jgi:Ser/Thr protein kinase RdoA (MazF antagonist)
MVVLDCEVAWYGDPAFDLAFLLNHLHLKGLLHAGLRGLVEAFVEAYGAEEELRRRTAILLPMLMLARVDGKSPVEYLTPEQRQHVREFTRPRIAEAVDSLDKITNDWFS